MSPPLTPQLRSDFALNGSIGTGHSNKGDVLKLRRALQMTGHGRFPRNPATNVTPGLMQAIEGFQRDFALTPDGMIVPGGPTEGALQIALMALESEGPHGLASVRKHFRDRARAGFSFIPDPNAPLGAGWRAPSGAQLNDAEAKTVTVRANAGPAGTSPATTTSSPQSSATATKVAPPVRNRERNLTSGAIRRGADEIARRAHTGGDDAVARTERVSIMKESMQKYLDRFDRDGLTEAAVNLRHYLSGSGKPKIFTRDQARAFRPIREAELENKKRFETRTFLGLSKKSELDDTEPRSNRLPRDLNTMKDGEKIKFRDKWDIDHDGPAFARDILGRDRDFGLAFGRTKVTAEGEFDAVRRGNQIVIEGKITHEWKDRYDFNNSQPGKAEARVLEPAGEAAPFEMGAEWQQKIRSAVEIRNGKLTTPKVIWTEIDPPK